MDDYEWQPVLTDIIHEIMSGEPEFKFTVIGSRKTAADIVAWMQSASLLLLSLNGKGYSGGAEGPDDALTKAVGQALSEKLLGKRGFELASIFIGWYKFNDHVPGELDGAIIDGSKQEKFFLAEKIAAKAHPVWDKLKGGGKTLQTRNCFQILTSTLNNPVDLMFFGASSYDSTGVVPFGGTATAWKVAHCLNIPTFDVTKAIGRTDFELHVRKMFADSTEKLAIIDGWKFPEVTTDGVEPRSFRPKVNFNSTQETTTETPSFDEDIDFENFQF